MNRFLLGALIAGIATGVWIAEGSAALAAVFAFTAGGSLVLGLERK